MNLYHCKRCNKDVPAVLDARGKEKVRGMRTGAILRFLACNHTQKVTDKPVTPTDSERFPLAQG